MKPEIKAVFFDVDGTLVSFKTHKIPESTIEALHKLQENEIKVVVSTGRAKQNIDFLKPYFTFDAYIASNGQNCFTKEESIYRRAFREDEIAKLLEFLSENHFPCQFVGEEHMYINYINDVVRLHHELTNLTLPEVQPLDMVAAGEIFQIVAYLTKETEQQLLNKFDFISAERAMPTCLDVTPTGGGKAVGIEKIMHFYGWNLSQAMAFGDGYNDLSMIRAARVGIAMGNAVDPLKECANYITDSVDEDGVYHALRHFKLI